MSRGRPKFSGRIYWPDVRQSLEAGMPLWEIMAVFDVDRRVIYNAFRRYGWSTDKLRVRSAP